MTTRTCIGFVLSLALACSALAEPPVDAPRPHLLSHWLWTRNCPPTGCCPDDYCRKPLPIVPLVHCGGHDDYCRKPLPTVPLVHCGGHDDYCRKPLPTLLCPPLSPYLQCGPPNGPCASCGRHR